MRHTPADILAVLDAGCDAFVFPMLDNGYVYLAGARMSAFHSATDWALVFEIFGYSPRAGLPDTAVITFASTIANRKTATDFTSPAAYEAYLRNNPNQEYRNVYPIDEGSWIDGESLAANAVDVTLRGSTIKMPAIETYSSAGVELSNPPSVEIYEFARYLAAVERERVLATPDEIRGNIPPDLTCCLQLDEWQHPDLVNDARPSREPTFQAIAAVLSTGDASRYRPTETPNTHWKHWPDGGSL